jgi:Zn-dependent peptidase ImmA (M78 family)
MTSIKVAVSNNILSWAMQIAERDPTKSDAYSLLYQWRSGEKEPTFAKIEDISAKIHIPLGYFFLNEPPKEILPILEYRTIDSETVEKPSRDLVDTIHSMENIQDWMHDYLIEIGRSKLGFIGSARNDKSIQEIVARIRDGINLKMDWQRDIPYNKEAFQFLRKLFENMGILVMTNGVVGQNNYRHLDINEFRAFTLIDDYAPLLFINGNDTKGGKAFSLLHEAAHVWLGVNNFYNDTIGNKTQNNQIEATCNAVAAELLIPTDFFIKKWAVLKSSGRDNRGVIMSTANYFKCGEIVVARKALDNKYISQTEYDNVVSDVMKHYYSSRKNKSGGDYYKTNASRFGSAFILALDNSVREGKTSYMDAYRLTNTAGSTFETLVAEVRGER